MSTIRRNREVAGIAVRLDRLSRTHLFTSYQDSLVSASADFQIELPLPLPTGPCAVWLSASTVIGCEDDAADWPAWTGEVRFASGEGVAR